MFYLNLRAINRLRNFFKYEKEVIEILNSLPTTYLSFPNVHEILDESSTSSNDFQKLRVVRSLASLTEINNQQFELINYSPTISTIEENLIPVEKLIKIVNFTKEDVRDTREPKHILNRSTIYGIINKQGLNDRSLNEEFMDIDSYYSSFDSKSTCTCSDSEFKFKKRLH
jgi:hypothetical protein